jgi:hypothetical protein
MREILLTQGRVALVDDADYEWLMQWRWRASQDGNCFYAIASTIVNGKKTNIKMHRLIAGAQKGEITDHRDGDGLNNTRTNLRTVTSAQNCHNRQKNPAKKHPYKGIKSKRGRAGYEAYITVNHKHMYVGYGATPEDAARAYDRAALAHFGEFARLNFPQESTP